MTRRPLAALLVLPALLALTACDPGSPSSTPSDSSSPASASPSAALGAPLEVPLSDTALLRVQGVVTADSGEVMDVALVVDAPTTWDSPAAPERPVLMSEVCAGYLDAGVYQMQGWTFLDVHVIAQVREGSAPWPADLPPLTLAPFGADASVASSGFPGEDADASTDTPHCARDRQIDGPGEGSFVVGLVDDIHLEDTATNAIKWAGLEYGFTVPGVILAVSDCSVTVTDLGTSLGWPASGAGEDVTDAGCRYGVISGG